MDTVFQIHTLLVIHLCGLALMAGTTVADYSTFTAIARNVNKEKVQALKFFSATAKLSALLGIGAALLILSGTGLLLIASGVFMRQLWFKIKLSLIATLVLNGFIVGSTQKSRLKKYLQADNGNDAQIKATVRNIKLFYIAQIGLFVLIVVLSVFRFN